MVKGFVWNCCTCTQDGILATFNKSCIDCGHKICEVCVYYRTSGHGSVLDQIQHVDLQNFKGSAQNEGAFSAEEDRISKAKASKPEKQPEYFARITWEGSETGGKETTGHWGHSSIPREPNAPRPSSSRPAQTQTQPKSSKKAPLAAKPKSNPTAAPPRPEPSTAQSAPAAAQPNPNHPASKSEAITFVDTLGKKFHFPFELCKTWKGMQELIREACKGIESTDKIAKEGNYSLVGPEDGIILPQVWEMVIQPGWTVSMQRSPVTEETLREEWDEWKCRLEDVFTFYEKGRRDGREDEDH